MEILNKIDNEKYKIPLCFTCKKYNVYIGCLKCDFEHALKCDDYLEDKERELYDS